MTKVTYITLLIKILPLLALSLFAKEPYSINIFPFSTKLKVFYKVDKNRNGYDITYIFKNDSKTPLKLPNIKIGYIFLNPKKYIYVLNTANSLNMQKRAISKTIYINGKKTSLRFAKVWSVADSINISSYRAELYLPKPKEFSKVIKIELR